MNRIDVADVAALSLTVGLVGRMLDLHHRLSAVSSGHEKRLLKMRVAQTNQEIDALLYGLHDLTPDEIAVVEASGSRPNG